MLLKRHGPLKRQFRVTGTLNPYIRDRLVKGHDGQIRRGRPLLHNKAHDLKESKGARTNFDCADLVCRLSLLTCHFVACDAHWQGPDHINEISRTIELHIAVTLDTEGLCLLVKLNPDVKGAFVYLRWDVGVSLGSLRKCVISKGIE